jgi:endonuclease/exonuclease/phosphatase family metal-dependent hydrolase
LYPRDLLCRGRPPVWGQDGVRIDWILARGTLEVGETAVVTYAENGQFPSDHFPVAANPRF